MASGGRNPTSEFAKPRTTGDWCCTACREEVPGGFEVCWNCGRNLDGQETPDFVPVQAVVREKVCRACGYSLEGLERQVEQRCPECGTEYDRKDFSFQPRGTDYSK